MTDLCRACQRPNTTRYHYWDDDGTAGCRQDRNELLRQTYELDNAQSQAWANDREQHHRERSERLQRTISDLRRYG